MLGKRSRHLVLQFLQARKADWHKGNYEKLLAITAVKMQTSGISAEFGPCSFWSSTSYIFFPTHMLKVFTMKWIFSKFPLGRCPSSSHIFILYFVLPCSDTQDYTEDEKLQLPQTVLSLNCSCLFLWWHFGPESTYSVWLDSEALRFWKNVKTRFSLDKLTCALSREETLFR